MSSNKRVSAETKKTFLKSVKLLAFLEASGQKQILNQGQNKRRAADEINFKFFKILIERCPEFTQFIRFVHKTDTENALDVIEFQFITILNQMIVESEERKAKLEQEELEQLNAGKEDLKTDQPEGSYPEEGQRTEDQEYQPPVLKTVQSKQQSTGGKQKVFGYSKKAKQAGTEAIMFDGDDEDDDLEDNSRPVRGAGNQNASKFDEKTRKYLESIKKYQDDDEYDDTHDAGDYRNKGRTRGSGRGRGGNLNQNDRQAADSNSYSRKKNTDRFDEDGDESIDSLEEDEDRINRLPLEQENEDSMEDIDPMSKWEKTRSRNYQDQDDQDNGPVRRLAGGRGAARGGNQQGKRDMKKEKHKQGGFDNHQKRDTNPRYPIDNKGYDNKVIDNRNRDLRDGDRNYQDRDNKGRDIGDRRDDYEQRDNQTATRSKLKLSKESEEFKPKNQKNDAGYDFVRKEDQDDYSKRRDDDYSKRRDDDDRQGGQYERRDARGMDRPLVKDGKYKDTR